MESIQAAYNSFSPLIALGVILSYILVDALYAKYTLEVVSLHPYMSATIGASMHFLLAFGVIQYTENRLYIFPLVIGSWIGTYLVVMFEKKKKDRLGSPSS